MKQIYIFKDGQSVKAKIEKMYGTHGPYVLEGQRLDQLIKVQLLVDSSTTSTYETGTNTNKAKTGSMLGRAVVGGVLLGGAGAVVGGLSGKRETDVNTQSHSITNTELTAELIFENGNSLYVLLKDKSAFHWLLGFANRPALTDAELEIEKQKAIEEKERLEKLELEKVIFRAEKILITENRVVIYSDTYPIKDIVSFKIEKPTEKYYAELILTYPTMVKKIPINLEDVPQIKKGFEKTEITFIKSSEFTDYIVAIIILFLCYIIYIMLRT